MTDDILKIHLGILDKKRQVFLEKVLPYAKDFVLGGGTALALQLHHRTSFDFDFFSTALIPKNLLERLSPVLEINNIVVDTSSELTFFTSDEIKVTFLHYPFKNAFPVIQTPQGLRLFPVKEIAVKKAYTIGRRGEYRDYFDVYTILKNDFMDLRTLITESKKIYENLFEEKLFLQQLVYFDDLLNFEIIPVSGVFLPQPEEVKHFFEEEVSHYLAKTST